MRRVTTSAMQAGRCSPSISIVWLRMSWVPFGPRMTSPTSTLPCRLEPTTTGWRKRSLLRPSLVFIDPPAQARADDDGLQEADLVGSVVELHRHAADGEGLGVGLRDPCDGEGAVDDSRFLWALCLAGLVGVDPLVIVGDIGEGLDGVLV